MVKNLGPEQEDRGVEGEIEEIEIGGQVIRHEIPPTLDGTGQPAAPEDTLGND